MTLATQTHGLQRGTPAAVLVAAGGTGGHVFPAVAVARRLQRQGVRVQWVGTNRGLERRVAQASGLSLTELSFSGLRGKGLLAWLSLPLRLGRALHDARRCLQSPRPNLVMVFGGYVSFPIGLMARLMGLPLMVLEQNAVMGTANRWLARMAQLVVTSFTVTRHAPANSRCLGNPVREELTLEGPRTPHLAQRQGPLRVLVLGGSLGAMALNEACPEAFAQCREAGQRLEIRHQTGEAGLAKTTAHYQALGLDASLQAFVEDMQEAYNWADLLVCRAGASTVSELMAVALPAIFVPLPQAIDDHQTANARAMTDHGTGWLLPQTPDLAGRLAGLLQTLDRPRLVDCSSRLAKAQHRPALEAVVEEVFRRLQPSAQPSGGMA